MRDRGCFIATSSEKFFLKTKLDRKILIKLFSIFYEYDRSIYVSIGVNITPKNYQVLTTDELFPDLTPYLSEGE